MADPIGPDEYVEAVEALSAAFADEAAATDPDAPISSQLWPTAGELVDHLGQIQRWAAQVVDTGASTDRASFARPTGVDRVRWYRQSAERLTDALRAADPARECWTLLGAGAAGFWRRRMTHEARKHVWDLRSAATPRPPLPDEGGAAMQADAVDELFGVFLARTLRAGMIAPLPGTLVLQSTDSDDAWLISPHWEVSRGHDDRATVVRGALGDVVLFAWERMPLAEASGRLEVVGDPVVAESFLTSHVHP
ncbi:maleylpyruvate isomerase family mycothiol-dependent enzyme [Microbacterium awajiense]|uniref:Maleylpyruvate isomerase family mycothiol-dependent enzyme n=1 Tax=Microbacterium awajiense TaxID=415214 RepID=A0ABP7APA2_9MICO